MMNRKTVVSSVLALVAASPALAQPPMPAVAGPVAPPHTEMATVYVTAQDGRREVRVAAVESRVVTGRPYSAEATTQFVQVLGDGNKIVRKTTVRIFRDGDGRTRREELAADGTVKSISIYDPVAHVSYVLDPATRTATRSAVQMVYPAKAIPDRVAVEREAAGRLAGKVEIVMAPADPVTVPDDIGKRQAEVVARGGGAAAIAPRVAQDVRLVQGQKVALGQ
jgi:hypothetical protein